MHCVTWYLTRVDGKYILKAVARTKHIMPLRKSTANLNRCAHPTHDADSREFFDSDGNALTEEERSAAIARLQQVELCSPAVLRRAAENLETYRVPAEAVELLRETLKGFLGTKNYHNYTNHKQAADPSCKRWVGRGYPLGCECV